MTKLIDDIQSFDNARRVVEPIEYDFFHVKPSLPEHTSLAAIPKKDRENVFIRFLCASPPPCSYQPRPQYVDLASGMHVRQLVTTPYVTGIVTFNDELFLMYEHLGALEKICINIDRVVTNCTSYICCITTHQTCTFINTRDGTVACTLPKPITAVYAVHKIYYIVTCTKELFCFDPLFDETPLHVFDELCGRVGDLFINLYAVAVLTTDKRVWVYGSNKCISFITNGRGFLELQDCEGGLPCKVVLSLNAGAILLDNGKVWSWGSTLFGGTPRPGCIRGLPNPCEHVLSTANSTMAITTRGEMWMWSNAWFKVYDLIYSQYAMADRVSDLHLRPSGSIFSNHFGWLVLQPSGVLTLITDRIQNLDVMYGKNVNIISLPFGFVIHKDKTLVIYRSNLPPKRFDYVTYFNHTDRGLVIETAPSTVHFVPMGLNPESEYTFFIAGHIRASYMTVHSAIQFILITTTGCIYINDKSVLDLPCNTNIVDASITSTYVALLSDQKPSDKKTSSNQKISSTNP